MDFALYWFMFPIAIVIACIAMLSGIAGAAIFMPFFLLVFPLFGSEYVLKSPAEAIATALLTSSFGFISGFIAYRKRGLIDYEIARGFLVIAIPLSIAGSLFVYYLNPTIIRFCYGILMFCLVFFLTTKNRRFNIKPDKEELTKAARNFTSRDGNVYHYLFYKPRFIPTAIGGFFTGMLSTGIGEVTVFQLVKIGKMDVPVAAGTSVFIVFLCFLCASLTHGITLVIQGGITAIPWYLVCYTIPGVIIGGQIGPRLQGLVSSEKMVKAIALVFLIIGIAMIRTVI